MTRYQANDEAWRRWGSMGLPRVYTAATLRRTRGAKYEVSAYIEVRDERGRLMPKLIAFGTSDVSWEAAFADADARAGTPPTGAPGAGGEPGKPGRNP